MLDTLLLVGCLLRPGSSFGQAWVQQAVHLPQQLLAVVEDHSLRVAVGRAILRGAKPETIECLVGRPATINTIRDSKGPLIVADFEIVGVKHPENTDGWLRQPSTIVYWVRP